VAPSSAAAPTEAVQPSQGAAPAFASFDEIGARQQPARAQGGAPATPTEEPSVITDVLAAPFRGAFQGVYELGDLLALGALPEERYLGTSKTLPGKIVEGIAQFAVGFIPVAGWLGKASTVAKLSKAGAVGKFVAGSSVARGAIAGAVTDFSVFDGQQARLSNLIQEVPALQNPITEFLAAKEDDGEIEGRLKNAIEGIMVGGAVDLLFLGVKRLRAEKIAKDAGRTVDEVIEAGRKAVPDDELEAATKRLQEESEASVKAPAAQQVADGVDTVKPIDPAQEAADATAKTAKEAKDAADAANIAKFIEDEKELTALAKDITEKNLPDTLDRMGAIPKRILNFNTIQSSEDVVRSTTVLVESIKKTMERNVIPDAQLMKDGLAELEAMTGQPASSIALSMTQGILKGDVEATRTMAARIMAYRVTLVELQKEVFQKAAAFRNGGKAEGVQFLETIAIAKEFHQQFRTLRNSSGRSLRALGVNTKEIADLSSLMDEVLGGKEGTQRLSELADKVLAAGNNPAALSRLTDPKLSLGGKVLRIHNEYWMNSILSAPASIAVDVTATAMNTLWRPFEGIMGAMIQGDKTAAATFIKTYGTLFNELQEAAQAAFKAIKQDRHILDPDAVKQMDFARNAAGESPVSFTKAGTPGQPGALVYGSVKRAITSEFVGVAPDSITGQAIDYIGKVVNIPSRLRMGTDEFFAQINYRAAAKTKLLNEALSRPELAKDSAKAAKWVEDQFQGLITDSGARYSEAGIARKAYEEALNSGLKGPEMADFIQNYIKENFDPNRSSLSEFAREYARDVGFTKDLTPGTLSHTINSAVTQHPLWRLVMPFIRTPANLMEFVAKRSVITNATPFRRLRNELVTELASPDPLIRAQASGRIATSYLFYTAAAMAAVAGTVTGGGPANEYERKQLEATGWRPYSFKIGDAYVSYQRLDPFATFFGLIADTYNGILTKVNESADADAEDIGATVMMALAKNITNKSYLTGLSQILEAVSNPDRRMAAYWRARAGSYVPSFMAQLTPVITDDVYMKESRSILDGILKRVPYGSQYVEPQRNLVGEPVVNPRASLGEFVAPTTFTTKTNDRVFEELSKLSYGFSPPRTVVAGNIDLTKYKSPTGQTAYDRWGELTGITRVGGKTIRQALEHLMGSAKYKGLSDVSTADFESPRVAEVKRVVARYRAAAWERLMKEYPQLEANHETSTRNNAALRRGVTVNQLLPMPFAVN